MNIGLRIDVDTFRGTKLGVPTLQRLLGTRDIRATYFFSVGPDNMGRHLWRLGRPSFLWKMLRSNAPRLYGWDILVRGTLWPGPSIGKHLAHVIRMAAEDGHEIGLHAWDHHAWQMSIDSWDSNEVHGQLRMGFEMLTDILGRPPTCSASPAWRCNDETLRTKQLFPFEFNSDCRGRSVFIPEAVRGIDTVPQPQIPVTLPTYDELVGREGMTASGYYQQLQRLMDRRRLNVLAIHAEVEGIGLQREFERFLDEAKARGCTFVPLGALLRDSADLPECRIEEAPIPGRQGWVSRQVTGDGT